MKDLERIALLFDFYGPLLTERQQELMRAYFLDDLSLGEIAELSNVSRQAVHDQVKRAEASLLEIEQRLGLAAEHLRRQGIISVLAEQLAAAAGHLAPDSPAHRHVAEARRLAAQLLPSAEPPAGPHGKERDTYGAV